MEPNQQLSEIQKTLSSLSARIDRLEKKADVGKEEPQPRLNSNTHTVPPPPPPPPPHNVPPVPTPAPQTQRKEFALGGNIFAIIGVISLSIGAIAFYFYAITQGWITESIRVLIVLAVAALLIGAGEYLKDKYKEFASIITGGGLVLLYLSLYMANVRYEIIGDITAYGALLIITILGGFIAMLREYPSALILAMTGGYLTPIILGLPASEDPITPTAIYITILNIIVMVGAFIRTSWRGIALAGLVATTGYGLIFMNWYNSTPISVFFITIIANWIIYIAASAIAFVKKGSVITILDFFLVGLTGILTLAFLSPILLTQIPQTAGYIVVILSTVYLFLAVTANLLSPEQEKLRLVYAALFGTFLAVAIPLQLDATIIPIAWGVLGLAFSVAALQLQWYRLQIVSVGALGLALISYVLLLDPEYPRILFNHTTMSGLLLAGIAAAQWWCAHELERHRTQQLIGATVFLIIAHLTAIFTLSFEFTALPELTFIWTVGALILTASGTTLKKYAIVRSGLVTWSIAIIFLLGSISVRSTEDVAFINVTFLVGLFLAASTVLQYYISHTNQKISNVDRKILIGGANAIALLVLSAELYHAFESHIANLRADRLIGQIQSVRNIQSLSLNMLWALYGAALLTVGFIYRNRHARIAGITLIGVVIAKMFLIDIWSFDILYRFIAFTLLGFFLILIAFGYNSYKERIKNML